MKRLARYIDIFGAFALLWLVLSLLPLSLWFDPGQVRVSNGSAEREPVILFSRDIKRNVRMQYQVVVRKMGSKTAVCDPKRGPFTYRSDAHLPDTITLTWWTGGDDRCWPQPPGDYILETCWTMPAPFWGFVPAKTVCRDSNPFTIAEVASK